jgi:hypothetical protein
VLVADAVRHRFAAGRERHDVPESTRLQPDSVRGERRAHLQLSDSGVTARMVEVTCKARVQVTAFAERRAVIRERKGDPAAVTERAVDLEDGKSLDDAAVAVAMHEGERPEAVRLRQQRAPVRRVEQRRGR